MLTCGFQELSLSVLEIQGNVKQGGALPAAFFACAIPLPKIIRLATNFSQKYVSLFVNSPYLVYNKVESMCADTVSNSISTFVRKNVK